MNQTNQQTIFDYAEACRLRDMGLEQVGSWPASEWIEKARSVALMLAAKFGEVSIDEILRICPRPANINPNATGAVMRHKNLELIGWKRSEKVASRARRIGLYRLK